MDITLKFSFDLAINRDGTFQVVGAKPQNRAMDNGCWGVVGSLQHQLASQSRGPNLPIDPILIKQQITLLEPQDLQIRVRHLAARPHSLKNYYSLKNY
jgi:hypothetical protein